MYMVILLSTLSFQLQTPASFASSIQELIIALQRTSDPHNLQGLRSHLDKLSLIDPNPEVDMSSWEQLDEAMQSLLTVVTGLQSYAKVRPQSQPEKMRF